MPVTTAADIGSRIETLYGLRLSVLHDHADRKPGGTMLTALLRLHADTDNAERTIGFHRDRLRQLTEPDRQIDAIAARHLLDGAQRLALAVTARDAHIAAANRGP